MIKQTVKGDLLTAFEMGGFDYIGHQTNMTVPSAGCSGIARAIFDRYPNTAFVNDLVVSKDPALGEIVFSDGNYSFDEGDKVINIYGQIYTGGGHPDIMKADSQVNRKIALTNTLIKINEILKGAHLGLPLIASGLAKNPVYGHLDDLTYFKEFIAPIINDTLTDVDVTIVVK